jgi:hypothetical protein
MEEILKVIFNLFMASKIAIVFSLFVINQTKTTPVYLLRSLIQFGAKKLTIKQMKNSLEVLALVLWWRP